MVQLHTYLISIYKVISIYVKFLLSVIELVTSDKIRYFQN